MTDATEGATEAELKRLAELLKSHLSRPRAESAVEVAGLHTALRSLPAHHVSALRVQSLLDVAQFFYLAGQTVLGLEPVANAVSMAARLNDPLLQRRALSFHGVLLADSGNLATAVECYAEALDLAREQRDDMGECSTWNNLGATLIYAAQFSDAIRCLEMAVDLSAGRADLTALRQQALSNIALACLHSEAFDQGLLAARASVEALSEPTSASELVSRVLSEAVYARLLMEVHHLDEARRRCEIAKAFAVRSCSQRAEQSAEITEGMCEVYSGNIDIGLSRLQNALDRARIMKGFLRDALIAMVKAHDVAGNQHLALIHLRELLAVTRKMQQEKTLLHHELHLQQLGTPAASRLRLAAPGQAADSGSIQRDRLLLQTALLQREAIVAELVEDESGEHCFRVGKLAALLASRLGFDEEACFLIGLGARLHDIGKIGIPHAILARRGPIAAEHRALVRMHAQIGASLIEQSGLPDLQLVIDVVRHHHEWWDGSGYPDGLAGAAIPAGARIAMLADAYDVMTHPRPYKPAVPVDVALTEIERMRGTQFDPQMADVFIDMIRQLMRDETDLDAFLAADAADSPLIRARRKIAEALRRRHQA